MNEIDQQLHELTKLAALLFERSGDDVVRYFYTNADVPTLRASEQIVITIERTHLTQHPLPVGERLAVA